MFSDPYLENRLVLVARRGGNVSATSLAALKSRRIAIVEGYAYGEIESAGPTFVRSTSEENSIALLLKQAVDYVLMDELVVQYLVDNYPEEAQDAAADRHHAAADPAACTWRCGARCPMRRRSSRGSMRRSGR